MIFSFVYLVQGATFSEKDKTSQMIWTTALFRAGDKISETESFLVIFFTFKEQSDIFGLQFVCQSKLCGVFGLASN